MPMQPRRPLGNAIGSRPPLIVRCSHSTCTTRLTEISDVDVASTSLAGRHHGPLTGGSGSSEYYVGPGPWDHARLFFLSGLVPGTASGKINYRGWSLGPPPGK